MILRDFLYRDDEQVNKYLAQMEKGEYDEVNLTERDRNTKGFKANLKLPLLDASGENNKEGSMESSLTVRQTPESRFNRFWDLLNEEEQIHPLQSTDEEIWDNYGTDETLEIKARIELVPGVSEMATARELSSLKPMLSSLGKLEIFLEKTLTQMSKQCQLTNRWYPNYFRKFRRLSDLLYLCIAWHPKI